MSIKHKYQSGSADSADEVSSSEWNEELELNDTANTAPANKLHLFAAVRGYRLLASEDEEGFDQVYNPLIADTITQWSLPVPAVTTGSLAGLAVTATGTATAGAPGTSGLFQRQDTIEYLVTVAATTAVAGVRENSACRTVGGDVAGRGGFTAVLVWGNATGGATATHRGFCGMASSTAAPTDVEPSTITNIVGMGWDAADANVQLMHRNAGAVTKIDLGANFPVPSADRSQIYNLRLYSPPGLTQKVYYHVTRVNTGDTASGVLTTNLPSTTLLLAARTWMSVGGTSSVIGVAHMGWFFNRRRGV